MELTRSTSMQRHKIWIGAATFVLAVASCGTETPMDPDPQNAVPVANAGTDQTVSATLPVQLDGSASSDSDGDAITWSWSITASPAGSTGTLDDATAATPAFTPDVPGAWVIELTVSDGTDESAADVATITAEDNTSTETVGASGGQVTSADGMMILDIPAGALAADEEISITRVTVAQSPPELGEMDSDALIYDMKPDGLQFAQPAVVTLTPPESLAPEAGAADVEMTLPVMGTVSNGEFEFASEQRVVADGEAGTLSATGEIDHFSTYVMAPNVYVGDQATKLVVAAAETRESAFVDEPFWAILGVYTKNDAAQDQQVATFFTDVSMEPVQASEGTERTELPQVASSSRLHRQTNHIMKCTEVGTGAWGVLIEVEGLGFMFDGEIIRAPRPFTAELGNPVTCLSTPASFESLSVPEPEGLGRFGPTIPDGGNGNGGFAVARQGGATVTDNDGVRVAELSSNSLSSITPWGAAVFAATYQVVMLYTQIGLYLSSSPIPSEAPAGPVDASSTLARAPVDLALEPFPQPAGGPDMSDNITDLFVFGTEASGNGAVAVHHLTQNLSFFEIGAGGELAFRSDLSDAFTPGGVSIFGDDRPVTAYVQPAGFDEQRPMLVASIDPTTAESTLWRVDLTGGVAAATAVTNVFPSDEVRQVRCLGSVCAVGGYGTGFGFGGLSFFLWDGADGFTGLSGISGRTIGIDLASSASNTVLIARTGFTDDTYRVFELAEDGELLRSMSIDVPEGCTAPGHIRFRADNEVVITCNTSGLVVSDVFVWDS